MEKLIEKFFARFSGSDARKTVPFYIGANFLFCVASLSLFLLVNKNF